MKLSISESICAAVTNDLIEAYRSDGAVCIRSVIDESWLAVLSDGIQKNIDNFGPRDASTQRTAMMRPGRSPDLPLPG